MYRLATRGESSATRQGRCSRGRSSPGTSTASRSRCPSAAARCTSAPRTDPRSPRPSASPRCPDSAAPGQCRPGAVDHEARPATPAARDRAAPRSVADQLLEIAVELLRVVDETLGERERPVPPELLGLLLVAQLLVEPEREVRADTAVQDVRLEDEDDAVALDVDQPAVVGVADPRALHPVRLLHQPRRNFDVARLAD